MAKPKPKVRARQKAPAKPTPAAPAPRAKVAPARPATPPARAARRRTPPSRVDLELFAPLSEGERADALRCLLEDERLRALAKVGRYRVITVEALAVKPPAALAGRRLARLVIYDYASDRCVDACVDLERSAVCHVSQSTAQPMLSREEEADAINIADRDPLVRARRAPGDVAQAVLHYWSLRVMDFSFRRRSAAVLYGQNGARPGLVAIVNLVDGAVVDVQSAEQW